MSGGSKKVHFVRYLDWENRDLFNREVGCFPAEMVTAPNQDGICEVVDPCGKQFPAFYSERMFLFSWHNPARCPN